MGIRGIRGTRGIEGIRGKGQGKSLFRHGISFRT